MRSGKIADFCCQEEKAENSLQYIVTMNRKQQGNSIDEKSISEEQKFDGVFVLTTSRNDLTPEKIVDSYKNLQEVELLFDDLKNFVDIRPIRHWLEIRVRAHVFVCILSLLLKRIFEIHYLKGKAIMHPIEEISKSKWLSAELKRFRDEGALKN